jgi:hypothetical protein
MTRTTRRIIAGTTALAITLTLGTDALIALIALTVLMT